MEASSQNNGCLEQRNDLDGFEIVLSAAVDKLEEIVNSPITVDKKILQECFLQVEKGLRSLKEIEGVKKPSCLKRGGHVAYWIRKLKPFRIFDLREFEEYCSSLKEVGITTQITRSRHESFQLPESHAFTARHINEILAILVGAGLAESADDEDLSEGAQRRRLSFSRTTLRDLIAGLRLGDFSPLSLTMIIEAASRLPSCDCASLFITDVIGDGQQK